MCERPARAAVLQRSNAQNSTATLPDRRHDFLRAQNHQRDRHHDERSVAGEWLWWLVDRQRRSAIDHEVRSIPCQ
jgi:hypothetical protein